MPSKRAADGALLLLRWAIRRCRLRAFRAATMRKRAASRARAPAARRTVAHEPFAYLYAGQHYHAGAVDAIDR